jgi:YD repeat-containing protein
VVTTSTYDNVERLTKTVTARTEDSVVLAQHDFTYDARDQATTITRTNVLEVAVPEAGKSTAKFDDANQLVENPSLKNFDAPRHCFADVS